MPMSDQDREQVRTEVTEVVKSLITPLQASVTEVRTQLDAKREEGAKPDDTEVLDLEEKLNEREAKLKESFRRDLLEVTKGTLPTEDRKDRVWDGAFVRDANKIREGVHEHGSIEDAVKARAFDTTDLATAGQLTPRQANMFIDAVIAEQDTLNAIRTVRMGGPQRYIEELTLGTRKIRAGSEGSAPTNLAGVGSRRRQLTAVEVVLPEDITLHALEDNIEGGGLESHISRMLATQFGNDMNDLGWNGDASFTSTDSDLQGFLSINNGWLQIMGADASVHDFDASSLSSPDHTHVMNAALATMPNKFKRANLGMTFFAPVEFVEGYLETLAGRATALGDQVTVNGLPAVTYFGQRIIPDSAIDPTGQQIVLTPADNLVFGIHRDIRVESEYKPRKRAVEYTLSARTDYELAQPNAVVLAGSVPTTLF